MPWLFTMVSFDSLFSHSVVDLSTTFKFSNEPSKSVLCRTLDDRTGARLVQAQAFGHLACCVLPQSSRSSQESEPLYTARYGLRCPNQGPPKLANNLLSGDIHTMTSRTFMVSMQMPSTSLCEDQCQPQRTLRTSTRLQDSYSLGS